MANPRLIFLTVTPKVPGARPSAKVQCLGPAGPTSSPMVKGRGSRAHIKGERSRPHPQRVRGGVRNTYFQTIHLPLGFKTQSIHKPRGRKGKMQTGLRPTQLSCLSFKPRAPQPPLQDDRRPESTFWHSCLSPVTAAARPPSVRTAATRSCCREFKHWPHGHPLSIHDRPGVQTAQLPPSERLAHLPERITL